MMTPEQREQYERAAAALEGHELVPHPDDMYPSDVEPWVVVMWKAWDICNEQDPVGVTIYETDTHAARLLRECLEKGEVLK